ncbi:MAG: hypothetical protein HC884_17000 [Chloroflexaceae bacterium]|nr:hypothetical protein [Chloroflexaceae bacterium]
MTKPDYRVLFLFLLAGLLISISACEAGERDRIPTGGTGEGKTIDDIRIGEGLSSLESYTMNLAITFDTEGEQGTINMTMSANTTTNDMAARVSGSGPALEAVSGMGLEMYQVGGQGYLLTDVNGTPHCIRSPGGAAAAVPKIEDMVGDLKGLELISQGESVNGVMANRYSLRDVHQAFGQTDMQAISEVKKADVWIAQDGGYPVRIDIEATGTSRSGTSGTYTLRYDLTDINQVGPITLPEACENASGFPELPELP